MTWEIIFIIVLLAAALASFLLDRFTPDLTALLVFSALLVSGILTPREAFSVFTNPAPIAVGAMFILSAALEKSGAIDQAALFLRRLAPSGPAVFTLVMILGAAAVSAIINNTLVVVVFLPVVLSLARELELVPSKLLIPLSYAAIFGGSCTLIGTSTNLLVSGIAVDYGQAPLGMFELAPIGLPLLAIGTAYLMFFGRRLLPARDTLTSLLTEDERREYIIEAYVRKESPLVGKTLGESGIWRDKATRVIAVIRSGLTLQTDLQALALRAGDRLELASRPSGVAHARSLEGIDLSAELKQDLEPIAAHEALIVEGVIGPSSGLIGRTLREVNFRQRYRMIVLGVHRRGKRVRQEVAELRLEFGDTLLLLGADNALNLLRQGEDILVIDRPYIPAVVRRTRIGLVLAVILGVIASATTGLAPIETAAVVGCVVLFAAGVIKPGDGYRAVKWNLLFLIFGMLSLGLAMEKTGTSAFFARGLFFVSSRWFPSLPQPLVLLAGIYLLTTLLTEVLTNNASAVLISGLAIGIAQSLGVSPRPFIVAVALAASASFATPIGYQTNVYVYGVGGYRFFDFVKVGAPLKLLFFIAAMILIPMIWSF
jgi:di/tricarboxylate transporter